MGEGRKIGSNPLPKEVPAPAPHDPNAASFGKCPPVKHTNQSGGADRYATDPVPS